MRSSPFVKIDEEIISGMIERIENKATSSLQAFADHLKDAFQLSSEPRIHLAKGNANNAIPQFARDHDIDMIVMGTVGRTGIPGLFTGNTAEAVLSSVDCSVLTTKPAGFLTPVADDS